VVVVVVVAVRHAAVVSARADNAGAAMFKSTHLIASAWHHRLAIVAAILVAVLRISSAQAEQTAAGFASPDEAVGALIAAVADNNTTELRRIFGPDSESLISSGDPIADQQRRQGFVTAYNEQHKLAAAGDNRMVLDVGKDGWPAPIPLVKEGALWHFDAAAGAQEIIDRRIGRNEIAAIRVALSYADAQKDYFERAKQASGTGEYAQRLISTPNRHDGLYWPVAAGELESPLAPLVDQAIDEGYPVTGKRIPYQGYYFRVLTGQGPHAPGGAKDYMNGGKMTGGFALLAWPATYGASGIMTFLVDQDGVVFQKDLGKDTAALAGAIARFDPDISWTRVDVTDN
jgi:hypothetical protein